MENQKQISNCPNCGANRTSNSNKCFYCGTLYEVKKPVVRERIELKSSEISTHQRSGVSSHKMLSIIMFSALGIICVAGFVYVWRYIRNKKKQEQLIAA